MERAWILLGMMGAGKTSVGRILASRTDRRLVDTDRMIERKLGHTIPRIFSLYGESTFRDHETSVLRSLEPERAVISTGGGIILRPENWTEFRRLGVTIFLNAGFDVLADRLERSKRKRPLLARDDWQERLRSLIEERQPLYEQADHVLSVDCGDPEEVAVRIQALMEGQA